MLQALPYIGTASDNNAISLATAYYANSISNYILKNAPQAKTSSNSGRREAEQTSLLSSLEKNQELKDIVLNETPWVADADNEAEQKRLLANYFDSSSLNNNISLMLGKLQKLQNQADGSWSWWQGMALRLAVAERQALLSCLPRSEHNDRRSERDKRHARQGNDLSRTRRCG